MNLLGLSSLLLTLLSLHPVPATSAPARPAGASTCHAQPETGSVASTTSLRPLRQWIRDLIRESRPGSATLDRLIRAAEARGAVIYVDEAEADQRDWGGRTIFTAASCGYTYLRIELRRLRPNDTAALLAHELQHALEIVSAGVTTADAVALLYRRIGVESRGYRESQFDTAAAVRAGRATLLELRHRGMCAPEVMASE